MDKTIISLAKDFTPVPSGRYVTDGPYSGQRFREEILLPKLRSDGHLTVDLDGTFGFSFTFLEEVFGGLVRSGHSAKDLRRRMTIVSSLDSYRDLAWRSIDEADAYTAASSA